MRNQFLQDVRDTIGVADWRSTHDMEMASELLAMAEDLEKAIKHAPPQQQQQDPQKPTW